MKKIRFGSVTIETTAAAPSKATIRRNIKASQEALARVLPRLLKPGVDLPLVKDVPYFWADPERPGKLIRELNGKQESGIFKDGKFRKC